MSQNYGGAKDAIGTKDYDVVTKKDAKKKDAIEAIKMDGPDKGKTIYIVTRGPIKDNGRPGLSDEEKEQRARKKEANQERELEIESRRRVIKRIIEKVNTQISVGDLKAICAEMYEDLPYDCRKNVDLELCGIDADEINGKFHNWEIGEGLPDNEFVLNKLLIQMVLIDVLQITEYNSASKAKLSAAAERYGIDENDVYLEVQNERVLATSGKKSKKG